MPCKHNWLPTPEHEAIDDDGIGNDYVCEHCDAVADECGVCGSSGRVEDDEAAHHDQTCHACDGEGIVEAKRVTTAERWGAIRAPAARPEEDRPR